jgi:hypothetical protein
MLGIDFSVFKELLPLLTIGGATVSAAGLIPRIGPGRAIWIGIRSRFARKPEPLSIRSEEIAEIKSMLLRKKFNETYLVVTGEKGVGKTCLLNTVLNKTPGVIRVSVSPKDDERTIIRNTLLELTGIKFDFVPPYASAKRLIFWYRFFTLKRSPIVVINATERTAGKDFASITGAVRILVEDYRLRVVVDVSPNSLDESLLWTTRHIVFNIKPMKKEMIWQMEQLQYLFNYIQMVGLEDTVFSVLGGVPSRYNALWEESQTKLENGGDPREIIGRFLCNDIYAAIQSVRKSRREGKDMAEIIKLFDKDKKFILSDTIDLNNLKRSTPDKVFREVKQDSSSVLIPATNAIGIVLQHGLTSEPSLDQLEKLLKNKP